MHFLDSSENQSLIFLYKILIFSFDMQFFYKKFSLNSRRVASQ